MRNATGQEFGSFELLVCRAELYIWGPPMAIVVNTHVGCRLYLIALNDISSNLGFLQFLVHCLIVQLLLYYYYRVSHTAVQPRPHPTAEITAGSGDQERHLSNKTGTNTRSSSNNVKTLEIFEIRRGLHSSI